MQTMFFYKWRPGRKANSYKYSMGIILANQFTLYFRFLKCQITCIWEIAEQNLGAFYDNIIVPSHLGLKIMALVLCSPRVLTET